MPEFVSLVSIESAVRPFLGHSPNTYPPSRDGAEPWREVEKKARFFYLWNSFKVGNYQIVGNRFDTQFFGFKGYGIFFVSLFIYWNIFDWRITSDERYEKQLCLKDSEVLLKPGHFPGKKLCVLVPDLLRRNQLDQVRTD